MVTSVSEMRAKRAQGVELKLPDYDDVVRIKPMDATTFVKLGRIPDYLSETVRQLIDGEATTVRVPPKEDMDKFRLWLDDLVMDVMVEPKVVRTPLDEDELGIDEISYSDKLYIYSWFGQPARVLRSFRTDQVKSLAIVGAAKTNGTIPQQAPGATAVVESPAGDV